MNHDDNVLKVNRNCQLCGHKATSLPTNFGSNREFDCPQCKTFVISSGIEDKIMNLSKDDREKLSLKAINTPQKMMLYIYIVNDEIVSKYRPISSLNQH